MGGDYTTTDSARQRRAARFDSKKIDLKRSETADNNQLDQNQEAKDKKIKCRFFPKCDK